MIKTETLQAFVNVAKLQSFTKAAQVQMQTPMALSKQISLLEKRLGKALFIRTTRKVSLTEFGESFYKKALNLLNEHLALEQWLKEEESEVTGHLRVCAQNGEMYEETIYPWLTEFCNRYPKMTMSFDVKEGQIDIQRHDFDVYWGVSNYLGEQFSGLKCRRLWKSAYGIFASPSYLEQFGSPTSISQLQQHQVIGYLHNQPNNIIVYRDPSRSDKPFEFVTLPSKIQTVTNLTELAIKGFGIINAATDQRDIKLALEQGTLVPILSDYWSEMAEIYVYYHQTREQQLKVRAFIDFFIEKRNQWLDH